MSWVLIFAAVGAAGASWFTPTPDLEADDAGELVIDALTEAGIDVGRVSGSRQIVHETEAGELIDAWRVRANVRVEGGLEQIELRVQQSAGQLVYVDDRIGEDHSERLLTDDQFASLGRHRDDTLANRWVLRNVLAAVAAVAVAGTCYVLATRSDPVWSAR